MAAMQIQQTYSKPETTRSKPSMPTILSDLLVKIIHTAWMSSLSREHRILLMKSLPLVNVEWNSIFTTISRRNVFLVNERYYAWYHKLVRKNIAATIQDTRSSHPISVQCQSISVKDDRSLKCAYHRLYEGDFMPYFKSIDFSKSLFPNLHTMLVEINNGFRRVCNEVWIYSLPNQLHTLDISYIYAEHLGWLPEKVWKDGPVLKPGPEPSFIRTLSLTGTGSECIVQELAKLFSGLETLKSDGEYVDFKNLPEPRYLSHDNYNDIASRRGNEIDDLGAFTQHQEEMQEIARNEGISGVIYYTMQVLFRGKEFGNIVDQDEFEL